MITSADRVLLARLVGESTFERGVGYARTGAVRKATWSPGGTRVVGEIQGGEERPYYASVELTRSSGDRLSSFDGTCTCPVGWNCKHAVALVLAGEYQDASGQARSLTLVEGGTDRAPRSKRVPAKQGGDSSLRQRKTAGWELPLLDLLAAGTDTEPEYRGVDPADWNGSGGRGAKPFQIGLQFELVPSPRRTNDVAPRSGRAGPGIRVRPVLPGQKGNWIRTGVSWSNLEYLHYGRARTPGAVEQVAVARELLALSRLSRRGSAYRYGDDVVWLESITSRRLWDLLGEARDLGMALVGATRPPTPVIVHSSSAAAVMEVSRPDPSGLSLTASLVLDGQPIPLTSSVLLGWPAHGIAWWDDRSANFGPASLELAALTSPLDDAMCELLETRVLDIPADDEDRFLRSFLPTLRRKLPVRSSDPEVELPEEATPVLVLSVGYGEAHRIVLTWFRGTVGSEFREALWDDSTTGSYGGFGYGAFGSDAIGSGAAGNRAFGVGAVDSAAVGHGVPGDVIAEAMVEVGRVAASVSELFEYTSRGRRLAASSELEGMAAVRFATEVLPLLADLAGVEIVEDGPVPEYHEEVAAPVVSLSGAESKDNDWFDLTVTVTVGGQPVPFADLFVALAEERSHLILPSGTYFSLDRVELRELAQLIAEARALLEATDDTIRLSRFQASLFEDLQRIGVVTGFNWLAYLYEHRLGGILADDMGLGKTLEALALICHTRDQGLTDAPYLVVAPTTVVGNWASECQRFAPGLRVATVTETTARRGMLLAEVAGGSDVVITSYSLFRIEYEEYAAVTWAGLFLDEAQFAKNRRSQTYQRAKLLPVPFKVAMTGTPIENNLMELWSLLSITAAGLFVNPDRFGEYYRLPIERAGDTERLAQLRRRIRPVMLRRTKEQVASDLPDKQEQVLELELSPKHRRVYQTYLQRERQKVLGLLGDMSKNRMAIFRSLTLLRQASLDVSLIDDRYSTVPSTKLDALMEMLEDIVEDGHRVLVFSQFTRFLTLARKRIAAAGIGLCYLDGRTRKRDAVIDEFRSGDAPVFLISLKAGGFGLNLTEADYCILLDPWWNPATEAQAVDRVHRIGQTRKVMVYRLVAKDTIEEKVMALKARKSALFADVMDAGGLESGALTARDIQDLLE
jgi:superfamily II DNA or RNA helicase